MSQLVFPGRKPPEAFCHKHLEHLEQAPTSLWQLGPSLSPTLALLQYTGLLASLHSGCCLRSFAFGLPFPHSFPQIFHDICYLLHFLFFIFLSSPKVRVIYLSFMRTKTLSLWGTAVLPCLEQGLKHDRHSINIKWPKKGNQWQTVLPSFSNLVPPYCVLDTARVLWHSAPPTVLVLALCDLYIVSLIYATVSLILRHESSVLITIGHPVSVYRAASHSTERCVCESLHHLCIPLPCYDGSLQTHNIVRRV